MALSTINEYYCIKISHSTFVLLQDLIITMDLHNKVLCLVGLVVHHCVCVYVLVCVHGCVYSCVSSHYQSLI